MTAPAPSLHDSDRDAAALLDFARRHPRLFVITGAGCSTGSNIPDYRDEQGDWKRKPPVLYQDFVQREAARKRYWGRSLVAWQYFSEAHPNDGHRALAQLERMRRITCLVTQNVDNLHQRAGSRRLIPLHGNLDTLSCRDCCHIQERRRFQDRLLEMNRAYAGLSAPAAPDGDADLDGIDFGGVQVPDCELCGSMSIGRINALSHPIND